MATKIIQVVYCLERGGSENLARSILLGLDRGIYESSICALGIGGGLEEDLSKDGIRFYVMNRRTGFDKALIWRLCRLFRRERVDIVQTHHLGQLMYSVIGARIAGAKLIHVEHEYYTLQSLEAQRRLRWLAKFCVTIVGVSRDVSEFLSKQVRIPAAKMITIPNGVDCERFALSSHKGCEIPDCSTEDLLVGTVARLEREKDPFTLLEAFQTVRHSLPRTKLIIVGEGSVRASLERRATDLRLKPHVIFMGERSDIPQLLAAFDVFVLSSIEEGLPLVILEAMAVGKPVVATSVGGIPEIVHHGKTGLLVPPQNPGKLAEALIQLLSNSDMRKAMGKAGRAVTESRFNLRQTVKAYQALYESVLKAPKEKRRDATVGTS